MGTAGLRRVVPLTPPGSAAVAVLGLTGHPTRLHLVDRAGRPRAWPGPDRVRVGQLIEGSERLDEVVALGRPGGVELHIHGGRGVVAAVVATLEREGFESMSAGPLPAPASLRAARAWLSTRSGPLAELDRRVTAALTAGVVDAALAAEIADCLSRRAFAERLCRPAVVRLVGRANAGKSTLFNALLGSQRALVSPAAGTTRDTVRASWRVRGVPLLLEDTAGEDAEPGSPCPSGADLAIHLCIAADEVPLPGEDGVLPVLGKADLQRPGTRGLAVSGRTGQGLEDLVLQIGNRLGLTPPESEDGRVPVDRAQVDRWLRAAALHGRAQRHSPGSRA